MVLGDLILRSLWGSGAEHGAHSRASWPKVIRAKLSLPPIPSKGFAREHLGMYIARCKIGLYRLWGFSAPTMEKQVQQDMEHSLESGLTSECILMGEAFPSAAHRPSVSEGRENSSAASARCRGIEICCRDYVVQKPE